MGKNRKRPGSLPDSEKENVSRMIAEGLSDTDIAARYGVVPPTVCMYRRRHGIAAVRRQGRQPDSDAQRVSFKYQPESIPAAVTTYQDEQGRTVTKLPPGWAHGVPGPITAK